QQIDAEGIDVIFNFRAEWLRISNLSSIALMLPQFNLSTLLNLSQNVEWVTIDLICPSLSVHDLCTFRKLMLEGECKAKNFWLRVEKEMEESLMEKFSGMAIDDARISKDESAEFYIDDMPISVPVHNYIEGDLHTEIGGFYVCFNMGNGDKKPEGYENIAWHNLNA
ncbi:hypothetical protein PENTCL1PPCAC_21868, partial [Pristionchus entomophagus]